MQVECARDGQVDRVVVRCSDPDLQQAFADLYFSLEDDGSFAKRFPAGSVTDAILAHLRAALTPLLRQTARLDEVPWREALHATADRLDGADIGWWLAGSAALAVRGLNVEPRDLDLVISESDVGRTSDVFADALIEPVVETAGWISRWFGRAWLAARVEWVAGVAEAVDQPLPSDFGPVAAARLTQVEWEQRLVRVPPLDLQREVSARRGLEQRVALIDALRRQS